MSLLRSTVQQRWENYRSRALPEARAGGVLREKWKVGHRQVEEQAVNWRHRSMWRQMPGGHAIGKGKRRRVPSDCFCFLSDL